MLAAFTIACGGPATAPLPKVQPVPTPAPPPATPHAQAILGLSLLDQKRYDEAVPVLTAAADANPLVAPFLRLRIAAAESARNNNAAAIDALARIITTAPTSSAATIARLRLPALYATSGDQAAAEATAQQLAAIPIDELTESEFVAAGRALAKANRLDLANTIRMHLLTDYTSGRWTEELYDQTKDEVAKLPMDAQVALASKLAKADRYDQALDLLQRIATAFPESQTADLVRSVRIRALFNSRNYTTLLDETANVELNDPALMLTRARAAWRVGRSDDLLAGLTAVETQFPASKEATEAKVIRSKYETTDAPDYTKAAEDLAAAIAAGAEGSDGENLWTLGWILTLAQHYDDALKVFDQYTRAYPDGDYKTNSLFWSAKILEQLGRTAERDAKAQQIVAEFPFSYYAYRAKELWPAAKDVQPAATTVFPDVDAQLASVTDPRLPVIRELEAIGLTRDASREAKQLAAANPDNLGLAFLQADLYVEGGEPFKANGILQRRFRTFVRHGGVNVPQRFWEILFPLAYGDILKSEAEKRGIDPYLMASIIRQESGFEPTTVSNAGAVGLMQIMPAEAPALGAAAGLDNVTRDSLFDPATNIAIGITEFKQKLAAMGSEPLAIAAYNAGEDAVRRWAERTPTTDLDVFIESIPFAETKLYVKTVTRNRHEYRRIYERASL